MGDAGAPGGVGPTRLYDVRGASGAVILPMLGISALRNSQPRDSLHEWIVAIACNMILKVKGKLYKVQQGSGRKGSPL